MFRSLSNLRSIANNHIFKSYTDGTITKTICPPKTTKLITTILHKNLKNFNKNTQNNTFVKKIPPDAPMSPISPLSRFSKPHSYTTMSLTAAGTICYYNSSTPSNSHQPQHQTQSGPNFHENSQNLPQNPPQLPTHSPTSLFTRLLNSLPQSNSTNMLIDPFSNFLDHFPIPKAHAMIYQAGKARSGSIPYSMSTILPFGGLRTDQWLEYPMTNSYQLTQNRVLYHFQLPDDAVPLRLPASSFVLIRMLDEEVNEYKYATYFPLSDTIDGEFAILGDLDPTGHDNLRKLWPNVKVGDSIEFMGPFYTDFSYRPFSFDEIIMLIGGPDQVGAMFQVYRDIYDNDNDHTRVHIIYCNKDADRTLFKEVLDFPRNVKNVKQFVITYVLDKKGGQKDFAKGFIENTHYGRLTKYKLHRLIGSRQQTVLDQGEKRKILVSGSASFMADVCGMKAEDGSQGELLGWLKDLGYKDYEVMKF